MTNPTASDIVFAHIETNPGAFLEALNDAPPEQQKAVLAYLETLPEIQSQETQTNQSEEAKK